MEIYRTGQDEPSTDGLSLAKVETPEDRESTKADEISLRNEDGGENGLEGCKCCEVEEEAIVEKYLPPDRESNGRVCIACSSTKYVKQFGKISLCIRCCEPISHKYINYLAEQQVRVIEKYNIGEIEKPPTLECNCGSNDVLPFDFYSQQFPTGKGLYYTVLNTQCRGCGGYREVSLYYDMSVVPLKEPSTISGLKLFKLEKKKGDYYT